LKLPGLQRLTGIDSIGKFFANDYAELFFERGLETSHHFSQ